ncbi:biliverdin-producing heme oxygenase [Lysobacter humi (ex Lee et al. 2017)]
MTPPTSSLRWSLRQATASAHARLDARVGAALNDPARYPGYLRGMHRFLREATVALPAGPGLAEAVAALEADLADVGATPLAISPTRRVATPDEALGWRYVIAGASVGARVLQRRAAELGFDGGHGARFLALHAAGDAWADFLAEVDGRPADRHAAVLHGASRAFHAAEAAFATALAQTA